MWVSDYEEQRWPLNVLLTLSPGLDLNGNTFWEFRDSLSSHKHRMRRIVQYSSSTHYSEIKISPQWHQWLRHTRPYPPSLTEQSQDVIRQQNLKLLAAEADARWAAKPSFLDSPGQPRGQPLPALQGTDAGRNFESEDRDGARKFANSKTESIVREMDNSTNNKGAMAQKEEMHLPDGTRDQSKERSVQDKTPYAGNMKDKPDPWKQARGNHKSWQPAAWDGSLVSLRR